MSIEVKNLSFFYGKRQVLHDVSFTVGKGEFLSILGPNGVGKSTLFRCVLGLLRDYTGSVFINGIDAKAMSVHETAKHIAYIPQSSSPAFNYSVYDIVLMGTAGGLGSFASPKKEECEKVDQALDKTGISHLASRCFHRISGGERQLALIARALVQDAKILMLDEPAASLDFGNQLLVLRQARALAEEGYTVIQTSHNPEQSYLYSERILTLKEGRILAEGSPQEVLKADVIESLYGERVQVISLYGDKYRVCVPNSIIQTIND